MMTRKYLVAVLTALAVVAIFPVDASAMYDAPTGRWMQRDPIGYIDGMSLYQAFADNPMRFNDPQGLLTLAEQIDQTLQMLSRLRELKEHNPETIMWNIDRQIEEQQRELSRLYNQQAQAASIVRDPIDVAFMIREGWKAPQSPFGLYTGRADAPYNLELTMGTNILNTGDPVLYTWRSIAEKMNYDSYISSMNWLVMYYAGTRVCRTAPNSLDLGDLIPSEGDSGRAANKLRPDPYATGAHTVIKRDAQGNITGYETYSLQTNPRNPNPWQSDKRVDLQGEPHFDKTTGRDVPTPHVHDSSGVRPGNPEEIP